MSEATLETDVEGLIERLRSSAAAFGKHPIHTADGDPVLLTVQAEELEEAASTFSRLSEQVKALEGERDAALQLSTLTSSADEVAAFATLKARVSSLEAQMKGMREALKRIADESVFNQQRFAEDTDTDYFLWGWRAVKEVALSALQPQEGKDV